jgi:hypothetical protein
MTIPIEIGYIQGVYHSGNANGSETNSTTRICMKTWLK